MDAYLAKLKTSLVEREQTGCIHAVIGNEACDLDSTASAIIYAYYLHTKKQNKDTIIIPVLNIASSQFRLRTETTHFFKKLNIPSDCLVFKDNVEFSRWQAEGRLKLTLVDHNILTGRDVQYEDCVLQVIDHHVLERKPDDRVTVKLDFVGSCCTLVAEELLNDPYFEIDATVAELLYGTILVDTINRSPEAGKITPRDEAVLCQLQCIIPNVKGDNLFEDIQTAKFDISGLLNMEILEKDLKMVTGTAMTISMCSVTMEMEELLGRDSFKEDLDDFCEKQNCDVVVIMTLINNDEDKPERQIAVYSQNRIFRDQISDTMDNCEDIDLGLEPMNAPFDDISVYAQNNVQASRKKVMPILKSFLHGDITPDVSSKDFVTQTSVAVATEGFSHVVVGESETVPEEKESESRVKFTIESLERNSTDDEVVPIESFEESYKNFDSVELDSTGSLGANRTVHVQQIPHDFDLSIKAGQQSESNKTSQNTQNPFGDLPSSDFNSGLLSSAHSSNIFDLGISDSELVDPFSSVEDPVNSESLVTSPKENVLPESSENEAKSVDIPEDTEPHVNELSELGEIGENQDTSSDSGNPMTEEMSVTVSEKQTNDNAQNGNPFVVDDLNVSDPIVNFQLSEYEEDSNVTDDIFNINTNNSGKLGSDNFLDMSTLRIEHPPTKKSASLIVECDDKSQADDLAELEESEIFDKLNTPGHSGENSPFAMSGINSPFINSGTGTPFELSSTYHSRTASESGLPDVAPPPNSLMDQGFSESDTDRRLPSFNSAEMVERIQQKKASLGGGSGLLDLEEKAEDSTTPYTPQNSYHDGGLFMRDNSLPTLMDSDFVDKVQQKRDSLSANLLSGDAIEGPAVKPTSTNPFGDFTDTSFDSSVPSSNPFFQTNQQSLEFDPFGPVETGPDNGNEQVQGGMPGQDFIADLSEFKPSNEDNSTSVDILDIFGESNASKSENLVGTQTGSQDWFGFSSLDEEVESKPEQTLNPFLTEFENNAQTEQSDLTEPVEQNILETNANQCVDLSEIDNQSNNSSEIPDQSVNNNIIIDQSTMKALNDSANLEAADTVSETLAREIIHDAIETFPDLSNPLLASEMMQRNDADWTEQGSGDSGIGSTGSPQQGPKVGAKKLNQDYSVETEYLPSMDPLHGSLNITSDTSSIETDADKEVVESESFRKVSGERTSQPPEQSGILDTSAKMEDIPEHGESIPDQIKNMIISDNIQSTFTSVNPGVTNDTNDDLDAIFGTNNMNNQSTLISEQPEVNSDSNNVVDQLFGTDNNQSTLSFEQPEVNNYSNNDLDAMFGTSDNQSTLTSEPPEVNNDSNNQLFGSDNNQSTLSFEQPEVNNDLNNDLDAMFGTSDNQSTLTSELPEINNDSNNVVDQLFGTDNNQSTLSFDKPEVNNDSNNDLDAMLGTSDNQSTLTSERPVVNIELNNDLDAMFGTSDNQSTLTSEPPEVINDTKDDLDELFGIDNNQSTLTPVQQEVNNDSNIDINKSFEKDFNLATSEVEEKSSNNIGDDNFGVDSIQSTLAPEHEGTSTNNIDDIFGTNDIQSQAGVTDDANTGVDNGFGTDDFQSTSTQPENKVLNVDDLLGQAGEQLSSPIDATVTQSDDLLCGNNTAEIESNEIIEQSNLVEMSRLNSDLNTDGKMKSASNDPEELSDVIEHIKEGMFNENIKASAVDMNVGNSNNNLINVFDDQLMLDKGKPDTFDSEGTIASSSELEVISSKETHNVESEGALLDFTNFENVENKNVSSEINTQESDFFNVLGGSGAVKEEPVNQMEQFESSNADNLKVQDMGNEGEKLKEKTSEECENSYIESTNEVDDEEIENVVEEADTNFEDDFVKGIDNKGFQFDSVSLSDVNIEKDSESMIEEEVSTSNTDDEGDKDRSGENDNVVKQGEPVTVQENDSTDMKKSDSDNSVSSDASSSFPTTSESESELVTVRENVHVMSDKRELFGEDIALSQQEGDIFTASGAEIELQGTGLDEDQIQGKEVIQIQENVKKENFESGILDLGLSEHTINNENDGDDFEMNEKESKTYIEEKEKDSAEDLEIDAVDKANEMIVNDNESNQPFKESDASLINVDGGMTESAVTIESVSSVETPLDEHASGFYEVNPEVIGESITDNLLTNSAYDTNLGENETGYYEVNHDQDVMIKSSVTTESMSSVDTPENENVTGFYEMNASMLEQAIEKDNQHFLNIDDAYSDASASPLETPETEEMKGFYDINADKLEKAIERIDSLDVNNSLMVDSTYSDDSSVSPMETPELESVSGFYQMHESVEKSNAFSELDIEGNNEIDTAPLGPEDAPEINIEFVSSPHSSKDSFDSETEPSFELNDNKSMEEERKVNEEPKGAFGDDQEIFGQNVLESIEDQDANKESEPEDECQARQSGEFDTAPEIMVEMTASTYSVESHDSAEEGFYEMNAEIQGTMLQNIAIGNAFSPIESPSEEVFNLDYEINPMVPDVHDMSSSQTSDDVSPETDNKPFVRFIDNEKEIDDKVNEMADDLVETALSEAIGSLQEQIFKDTDAEDKDEVAEDMIVVDKPEDTDKFVKVADDLVNEAISSAIEVVQEIRLNEEEQFITSEIASAMKESYDSSDSEGSSTTTEGSYRIVNSVDFSPAITPDRDEVTSPELVIGRDHLVQDDIFEENDLVTTEDLEDDIVSDKDTDMFTKINEEDDVENETPAVIDNSNADSQSYNDENGNITMERAGTNLHTAFEIDDAKQGSSTESNDLVSNDIVGNDLTKKLERQETLIPDIVISKEDTPPDSEESESESLNKTDTKPETTNEIEALANESVETESVSLSNTEIETQVIDNNESFEFGMQKEEEIDSIEEAEKIQTLHRTGQESTNKFSFDIPAENETETFGDIETELQSSNQEKEEAVHISGQINNGEHFDFEQGNESVEQDIVNDESFFVESEVKLEIKASEREIVENEQFVVEREVSRETEVVEVDIDKDESSLVENEVELKNEIIEREIGIDESSLVEIEVTQEKEVVEEDIVKDESSVIESEIKRENEFVEKEIVTDESVVKHEVTQDNEFVEEDIAKDEISVIESEIKQKNEIVDKEIVMDESVIKHEVTQDHEFVEEDIAKDEISVVESEIKQENEIVEREIVMDESVIKHEGTQDKISVVESEIKQENEIVEKEIVMDESVIKHVVTQDNEFVEEDITKDEISDVESEIKQENEIVEKEIVMDEPVIKHEGTQDNDFTEEDIAKDEISFEESEVIISSNDTTEIVNFNENLHNPELTRNLQSISDEINAVEEQNAGQDCISESVELEIGIKLEQTSENVNVNEENFEEVDSEKADNENVPEQNNEVVEKIISEKIKLENGDQENIKDEKIEKENAEIENVNIEKVNVDIENVENKELEEENVEKEADKSEEVSYHKIKDLEGEKEEGRTTKSKRGSAEYVTRKEIFYTSAGRMSISIDSVLDPPSDTDQSYTGGQDIIHEETHEGRKVSSILAGTGRAIMQADEVLTKLSEATLAQQNDSARNVRPSLIDIVSDDDTLSNVSEPVDDDDDDATSEKHVVIEKVQPEKTKPSHEKMKMDDTQEWHEDPIPGMGVTAHDSSTDESDTESDSEYTKPPRPDSLLNGARRKKKIAANNFLSPDSTDDLVEGIDDIPTPDDLETPSDIEGELEWEDDTPITPTSDSKKFVEYRDDEAEREKYENTKFRKVEIAGKDYRVDMKVIEPYKKVLSHGGYYGDGLNAIILFCGCYLPDRGRRDYQYVMDNLFLYVISTLELLVAEDYMIVYFHGATPRRQMPSFGWLKRCYQMIDRRLRKNLKALLMVHPTLWLKTVVMMTKPFISSKFSSKLRFVKTLQELGKIVPMEYIYVPEPVSHTERMLQTDPDYLEKWEKEQEKKGLTQPSKSMFSFFSRKKKDSSSK